MVLVAASCILNMVMSSRTKLTGAQTLRSVKCIYQLNVDGCQRTSHPPAVHIHWSSPANPEVQREGVTWFYNEVTVKETADFTYYCTSGFYGGYMGIQDRSPKWVIFSIWDKTSTDDNPKAPSDDLMKVLAQGVGVTVKRFAGKGTGGQTHLVYDRKVGQTRKCDYAIFTGWFPIPELNIWRLLASFQVRPKAASKHLEDPHSFLEDWAGTGRRRQGFYGPAWIKTDKDPWVQSMHGRGTTTGSQFNNRTVVLTDDRRRLGMITCGLALTNKSLGPYTFDASSIPPVLALNPLPDRDGAPARVQ